MTKRILVLILASDTDRYYCAFQVLWRQYMNTFTNIKCVFYKAHPDITEPVFMSDSNTLLVKMNDTFDTCYDKLIQAFNYFLPDLDKYDYVYRTNLSSFIIFKNYLEFCEVLPSEKCCSAFIGYTDTTMPFPSGAGFTLSVDLVKDITLNPPTKICQDDVTIGKYLYDRGITIIDAPRFEPPLRITAEYLSSLPLYSPNVFHFRLKNYTGDRNIDIHNYNLLLKYIYNI